MNCISDFFAGISLLKKLYKLKFQFSEFPNKKTDRAIESVELKANSLHKV